MTRLIAGCAALLVALCLATGARAHATLVSAEPEGIRLEFALPSGSYATVVLREFQKLAE